MVRAPCCEKMGLKKGPWSPEEDQILITYIQEHGHGNWRALPKQAGLLRCGKSCRLRWTNYLRPDIKRGNFSREEEETIIKLHEMLGNRWSTIAARLRGRTDNEIKNVWHTHLKKRLKKIDATPDTKPHSITMPKCDHSNAPRQSDPVNLNCPTRPRFDSPGYAPVSPQQSSSDFSSVTDNSVVTSETNMVTCIKDEHIDSPAFFTEIDESFWSEPVPSNNSSMPLDFQLMADELQFQNPFSLADTMEPVYSCSSNIDDGKDFWYNLFIRAGGLPELPEL